MGSTDLSSLACSANSPFFAYHPPRVGEKIEGLRKALQSLPLPSRLFYALKSNRFAPLLTKMQALGPLGIDACSPRELLLARQIGFAEKEISFTSTSVSDADLAVINRHPGVWLNCDSLSSIRRVGKSFPKRTIGLRINPGLGIGYSSHERLRYAGEKATKFGIYREDFEEALSLAKKSGLRVGGLHVHAGCGYLNPQLPLWNELLAIVKSFVDQVPDLEVLNLGGGLGIPLVQGDEALDLASWSASIARHFGGKGFEIWVEPGDYLVKDAGVLVLQVTSVERKSGTLFVGVDGGFNLHIEPAFYGLPLEVVPCRYSEEAPLDVTIAGNINEAHDLFAENLSMSPPREGDHLAFLNAGGYGASMSSDHCLRGEFREYLVY